MSLSWIDRGGMTCPQDSESLLRALDDDGLRREQELCEAELELECKDALLVALGDEQDRLAGRQRELEAELLELDARMHLALARDDEASARTAIHIIIARRRQAARLERWVSRLDAERARLARALDRQQDQLEALRRAAATPARRRRAQIRRALLRAV